MVLGNGLVANGFKAYENDPACLIFASGVSNSANADPTPFDREKEMLLSTIQNNPEKTIVYFSTCSIYDESLKQSPYVQHKLEMENLLEKSTSNFHIFRISNLAGSTNNPHTVLNFFIQHIVSGDFFSAWENASRNIIDMEDAYAIADDIIQNKKFINQAVNIANTANYPVPEIIRSIENFVQKKGNYRLISRGSNPVIDTGLIGPILEKLDIRFGDRYLLKILQKYYSPA